MIGTGSASEDLCASAGNGSSKDYFHMNSNFGGIPEALVIALLTFLCLILLSLLIRKGGYQVLTGLFCQNWREDGDDDQKELDLAETSMLGRFQHFLGCLAYSEEKMMDEAGPDAVQYLRFQTYLIGFLSVVSLLSIGIILPINMQGHNHRNASSPSSPYAQTVFDNLNSRQDLLLIYDILSEFLT